MDFLLWTHLLGKRTVYSAQPALPLGVHTGDDAVDSIGCHDIAQHNQLEVRFTQEPSCSV
jgi:hypothetical protein